MTKCPYLEVLVNTSGTDAVIESGLVAGSTVSGAANGKLGPDLGFGHEVHPFSAVIAGDESTFLRSHAHALLLGELPIIGSRQDELQGRKLFVPNLVTFGVMSRDILLETRLDVSQEIGEDAVEGNCGRKFRELWLADDGKMTRTEA
jgi:hypothetical protein